MQKLSIKRLVISAIVVIPAIISIEMFIQSIGESDIIGLLIPLFYLILTAPLSIDLLNKE